MNLFQPLILGIVQGLTEFLPISSSGHLIVIPSLIGWDLQSLTFDVVVHLGTLAALIVYFFKDLWRIGTSFIKDVWANEDYFKNYTKDGKWGLFILVGSIPAGILGYFLQDRITGNLRSSLFVAIFLLAGSVLMFLAEKIANWKKDEEVTLAKALIIGLFQSFALLPGVSRSGSTISGGMLLGLGRKKAARFSFLLSIPIVAFAGAYELYVTLRYTQAVFVFSEFIVGFLSSFIIGILAIKFLLKLLQSKGLYVFIVYRVILALLIMVMVL